MGNTLASPARPVKPSSKPRPKVYPAARCEVEVVHPIIYPCALRPVGFPGAILLNDEGYQILAITERADNAEGFEILGYRFIKLSDPTEPRDVECTRYGFECCCPDAQSRVRPGGCKHARCLTTLRLRNVIV